MTIIQNTHSMLARVGEGGYLLVYRRPMSPTNPDEDGRIVWGWRILGHRTAVIAQSKRSDSLKTGARALGDSPKEMMLSLISFLLAFSEALTVESENWTLFPQHVREWTERNEYELAMLSFELNPEVYMSTGQLGESI